MRTARSCLTLAMSLVSLVLTTTPAMAFFNAGVCRQFGTLQPFRPPQPTLSVSARRAAVVMMSDLDRAAKLRQEAEKLEQELKAVQASRPKPVVTEEKPAGPTPRYLSFEQLKAEVEQAMASSAVVDTALKQLKESGALTKFESGSAKGFRRYSAEQFEQATGFPPQDVESGGTQDDLKWALGAVMAASSLAVVGGGFLGGFAGTLLVYLFLLIPITFIGIGSVAPGVISVFVVLVSNLLDGKAAERKTTHQAARFLTGYLLGLPIESVKTDAEGGTTFIKYYDTMDGNFKDLGAQAAAGPGPEPRKKFGQEDILGHAVLAIAGSVAERMEYGKVIDRQADFLYLVALMDLVRPSLRAGQKNDLVLYSALTAHKLLTANKGKLERLAEKMAAKASLAEIVAVMES